MPPLVFLLYVDIGIKYLLFPARTCYLLQFGCPCSLLLIACSSISLGSRLCWFCYCTFFVRLCVSPMGVAIGLRESFFFSRCVFRPYICEKPHNMYWCDRGLLFPTALLSTSLFSTGLLSRIFLITPLLSTDLVSTSLSLCQTLSAPSRFFSQALLQKQG